MWQLEPSLGSVSRSSDIRSVCTPAQQTAARKCHSDKLECMHASASTDARERVIECCCIVCVCADTLKVRLQTQSHTNPTYSGLGDCVRKTWAAEGAKGFYKGVSSPLVGQMFFNAVQVRNSKDGCDRASARSSCSLFRQTLTSAVCIAASVCRVWRGQALRGWRQAVDHWRLLRRRSIDWIHCCIHRVPDWSAAKAGNAARCVFELCMQGSAAVRAFVPSLLSSSPSVASSSFLRTRQICSRPNCKCKFFKRSLNLPLSSPLFLSFHRTMESEAHSKDSCLPLRGMCLRWRATLECMKRHALRFWRLDRGWKHWRAGNY